MLNCNYYNEIKNELINNEVYKRVKDYSKNKNELSTYYNVGKLLIEAQGGEERAKYGDVPNVSAARSGMEGYTPSESYAAGNNSEEKKHDQFLCTDCIATEKLVSSTYNDDVFRFSASNIRRLLNHIQTEEQNHAEMIYKYKTANNMA